MGTSIILSSFIKFFRIGTGLLFAMRSMKMPTWTMSYCSTIASGTSEKASQAKLDMF